MLCLISILIIMYHVWLDTVQWTEWIGMCILIFTPATFSWDQLFSTNSRQWSSWNRILHSSENFYGRAKRFEIISDARRIDVEGMSAVTAGERCQRYRYGTELTTNEDIFFRKIVNQIVSNQSQSLWCYGTELTTNEGKKRVVENFELRSGEKHLLSNQSQSLLFSFRKIVDQILSDQSQSLWFSFLDRLWIKLCLTNHISLILGRLWIKLYQAKKTITKIKIM